MTVHQNGRVPFRARARLIRLLGEELISSEIMAVVELVKNAYDADAHLVTIRVTGLQDQSVTVIEVADDGDGMSLDTILHVWMEPAASHKKAGNEKRRTSLGRLSLGEKGVGRFAADKLGANLELVTRQRGTPDEIVLRLQWNHFDQEDYLEDIAVRWETRTPEVFVGTTHGTTLRMTKVRAVWDRALVIRARDGLARLVSPHSASYAFSITLECPELPDLTGTIVNPFLDTAPHRLEGTVDKRGILHLQVDDTTTIIDLRSAAAEHFMAGHDLRLSECGPFSFSFRVWDLDTGSRARLTSVDRSMRTALRAFSGVSIYRDGFRVMPYGEPGNDWLELNQRRVNNPTLRVSNNQIVGMVDITQCENPELRDRTSREGLIDNAALFDLKVLVLTALSILEEKRFAERHPRIGMSAASDEPDEVLRRISVVRSHSSDEAKLHAALGDVERAYREQHEEQQRRYEHVVRLAGIGLAAERMTPEFARTLDEVTLTLRTIHNEVRLLAHADSLTSHVERLRAQYELLDEQLDLMTPMYSPSMHDLEELDVSAVARDVRRVLEHRFRTSNTRLQITQDAPLILRMNRGHLMQVLLGLFDNAFHALSTVGMDRQPEICVHMKVGNRKPQMVVADNGPGIRPEVRALIFAPSFTSRSTGRGLGLYVIRDVLATYNASIDVLEQDRILPGANFVVTFDSRRQAGASKGLRTATA